MANDDYPEDRQPLGRSPQKTKKDRVLIRDAALTRSDCNVLEALRLFCVGYANPDSFAWEAGFDVCLKEFGPAHGPQIGMGIMNVMRSLRLTRRSTFKFTNPACPCCRSSLSEHELQLMILLKTEHHADGVTRQTNAVILCEGADSSNFFETLKQLTGHLNEFTAQNRNEAYRFPRKRIRMSWN